MKKLIFFSIVVVVIVMIEIFAISRTGMPIFRYSEISSLFRSSPKELSDQIVVDLPQEGASVTSPLIVTGRVRGTWFFEASFPISVVDWDGRIIGQGPAQAQSDWMTTEFVPFEATIRFDKPVDTGPQSNRGAIILRNDNPSGQASTSQSLEIPIIFQ